MKVPFRLADFPFAKRLSELRRRLFIVLGLWLVLIIAIWPVSEYVMAFVERPLLPYTKLQFDTLTAPFLTHFKATIFAAIFITLPVAFLQIWLFVRKNLTGRERKLVWPFLFLSYPLFIGGALFCYLIPFPLAVEFFIMFDPDITPSIRVDDYLTFVLRLMIVFGTVFEMPLVSLLLTRAGLLTPEFLSRNRRYAVMILFLVAAILTPPDVLSMIMLAVPLILLYELSILVSRVVRPKPAAQ